ncbi:hypothetical protein GALMADRAFT_260144 [Galerina marginata CBS 339.88]|uniref:DNA-directed RNA polymerase III subunit RPC4 n=1 Tax=Galerina marginata (strain CBS 339.88) TaxID=685588 RepID=A0A067S4K3_GALM3|nr:hypothetical protein GALMADRAFT_260144 [Galerina marginata CBS 339.88]
MADPSPSTPAPKAIGSLAKKQSDVTRQGTQKLKFVPTLPQRRKKEYVKPEPTAAAVPSASQSDRGRGRGRGRGDARGRGRGGGHGPVIEMTASGPFAMGPAMAGSSTRRSTPRSNFAPSVPTEGTSSSIGNNLSEYTPSSLRKDGNLKNGVVKTEDEEVYSDPDEGVEIIDMENVRQMDWMAPETLRKERQNAKKVKKEEKLDDLGDVNLSNAVNLSESEEEEELEDIIEDFATQTIMDSDESIREERLYFFQFPAPFPEFTSKKDTAMDIDQVPDAVQLGKKVSFAPDVKPDITPSTSRTPSAAPVEPKKTGPIDGVIGQLEVYRSGAVKIRLTNGMLLDVNAATQPAFLQQAVHLNKADKQLIVLGEVNKQFVVSPNVDALLNALESEQENNLILEGEETLLRV